MKANFNLTNEFDAPVLASLGFSLKSHAQGETDLSITCENICSALLQNAIF